MAYKWLNTHVVLLTVVAGLVGGAYAIQRFPIIALDLVLFFSLLGACIGFGAGLVLNLILNRIS